MKNQLIEGRDFYFNEAGFMVMTRAYHLERGYCCGNRCRHCPYGLAANPESPGPEEESGQADRNED